MSFKLPIETIKKHSRLNKEIVDELEIMEIYQKIFDIPMEVQKLSTPQKMFSLYSTSKGYLKNTQKLIKNIDIEQIDPDIYDLLYDIKKETGFREKYNYIEFEQIDFLNKNPHFLLVYSLYNVISPIISLALPVLLLLIPFFIIRLQGIPITTDMYFSILKNVLSKHSIGQIFQLSGADFDKKIYISVSFAFYLAQVYYNIMYCFKYVENMHLMHNKIFILRKFFKKSQKNGNKLMNIIKNSRLRYYYKFSKILQEKLNIINNIVEKYDVITEFSFNFEKITQIGIILKYFYDIYLQSDIKTIIEYFLEFNAYLTILRNIKNIGLNTCHFNNKKSEYKEIYYPPLINEYISNDISLEKSVIITGPNASGKTTLLKSLLMNQVFSQQYGCGFYSDNTSIKIYEHIQCYINIPDTSERDSLFQAEARRCKNILDLYYKYPDNNHFCIFDELFSGTNPYEAISVGTSFVNYLVNKLNITIILTTHFTDICNNVKNISNIKMHVDENQNYTYKISKGVSDIKGGINVLKQMKYPKEIIKNAERNINNSL